MPRLFGTDGIRGEINHWPLTPDFILGLGKVLARVIGEMETRPVGVIGRDPRQSGYMLESALAAGLMSQGVDVVMAGVITTPGVAYLARIHRAQLGVVISASHNPFDHNGIKVFGADGFKIPDEMELEIERLLLDEGADFDSAEASRLGRSWNASAWRQEYVDYLVGSWAVDRPLQGVRLVLDCADGATSEIAPQVFRRLGADLVLKHHQPDGLNINQNYEYIYPRRLGAIVLEEKADVGIAFDGDGDRVMLVDDKGKTVNGDVILAILARDMQRRGKLEHDTVVGTPMSNWGLKAALAQDGIRLEEVAVGDRFILQRMLEAGYTLGGEQSGHIIIAPGEGHTTGDGIYTALAVLKAASGTRLSELSAHFQELPECLLSVDVLSKPPLEGVAEIQQALRELHRSLGGGVDVNLRYSGTESKLRLKIRAGVGHDQRQLEQLAEAFMSVARRAIAAYKQSDG